MSATQDTGHAATIVLSVLKELPPETAIVPSEWQELLVRLCLKSDLPNLGILIRGFGSIPHAVWDYKNTGMGREMLHIRAERWAGRRSS